MTKYISTIVIFFTLLIKVISPVQAVDTQCTIVSSKLASAANVNDRRVMVLTAFFNKYHSILAEYAHEFINAADYYGIDWRLVPAITGTESTFAKFMPPNTYNAYGWNSGNYRFESWKDSIWHVTKQLKIRYVDKGATTVALIGRIYAPPSKVWAKNTQFFINKIEESNALALNL